ncbi:MAG: radical SAM family heme chaperone HemW [Clostridia bacterium]|nr:radical SAM family heme chaperone HemW [Clostridia bacterium]
MKGLYIHIPFCRSKCPYCDFYSCLSKNADIESFVNAVIDEIKTGRRATEFTKNSDLSFDTVYFGGGTPSVIGADNIGRIINCAKKYYSISDKAEITVECNPSTVDDEFFRKLSFYGVNRISLGMQSAVDNERRKLGRFADRNQVLSVIDSAKKYGIDNISLDVMLGIPDQTIESLDDTIDFCIETGAPHISAYMLSIEDGTVFHKRIDTLNLPDEDTVCKMYLHLSEKLRNAGFRHYEISNFAKSGYESRHNTKYWNCEEYLGIGPSAHSFIDSQRFFLERDINSFISGEKAVYDCTGGDREEYMMLRLRLSDGIVFEDYKVRFGEDFSSETIKKALDFEKQGLMTVSETSFSLTTDGFLISNYIISELIN